MKVGALAIANETSRAILMDEMGFIQSNSHSFGM